MAERALPPKLARLLDLLETLPDRAERMQLLIDTADRFRGVPERIARRPYPEDHKTPACESEVYVFAESIGPDALKFHFAVENPQGVAAKALAVILDETLSGEPVTEVARVPTDIALRIFGAELSMGKSMGLMGMVAMARESARRRLAPRAAP
jgi:cysteine desulfuration protein SufE